MSSAMTVILYDQYMHKTTANVIYTMDTTVEAMQTVPIEQNVLDIPHSAEAMVTAPHVLQYPELPRGCEITSLTMLLQYSGLDVDKLKLAEEMKKDTTPLVRNKSGEIAYWGNPNVGFVGNITLNEPGFGIYHAALFPLLQSYMPSAVDLTGKSFAELEKQVADGIPVVVWTTVEYNNPTDWVIWDTDLGPIRTTFKEHAVLLVGYDEDHVYINDPLKKQFPVKVDKEQFIVSWNVMGKQALSYENNDKDEDNV